MDFNLTAADRSLVAAAERARQHAHAPISNYSVGAAVLGEAGQVWTGCNVENIILGLSCCAEVVAVYKAVSEGARSFDTVAVVTSSSPPAAPCGSCRQVLAAWGVTRVVIANDHGDAEGIYLDSLLPRFFDLKLEDIKTGRPDHP